MAEVMDVLEDGRQGVEVETSLVETWLCPWEGGRRGAGAGTSDGWVLLFLLFHLCLLCLLCGT